ERPARTGPEAPAALRPAADEQHLYGRPTRRPVAGDREAERPSDELTRPFGRGSAGRPGCVEIEAPPQRAVLLGRRCCQNGRGTLAQAASSFTPVNRDN